MKRVEVWGAGCFESRISVPHDFPCEQGPQISLQNGHQRDSRYPSVINNETQ